MAINKQLIQHYYWDATTVIHIFKVNGAHVRNQIDAAFTRFGYNKRFNFIPEDELWIADDSYTTDMYEELRLEGLTERALMRIGCTYIEARKILDSDPTLVSVVTKMNIDYTATINDDVILMSTGAITRTISLPTAAILVGKRYYIKKIDSGAGQVVLDPNGLETIDGDTAPNITAQYESFTLFSDGSNWHIV